MSNHAENSVCHIFGEFPWKHFRMCCLQPRIQLYEQSKSCFKYRIHSIEGRVALHHTSPESSLPTIKAFSLPNRVCYKNFTLICSTFHLQFLLVDYVLSILTTYTSVLLKSVQLTTFAFLKVVSKSKCLQICYSYK